jgi:palmitoyl-protein thioesterase
LAREVVETCDIEVDVLYTAGSPHGGVTSLLWCDAEKGLFTEIMCEWINMIMDGLSHSKVLAGIFGPSSLLKPWYDTEGYHSWIPSINNAITIDEERKRRLSSVNHFAMFMWENDKVVIPMESSWFGSLDQYGNLIRLKEQPLYTEDWIGLKSLDEAGKLHFYAYKGGHQYLTSVIHKHTFVPLILGKELHY